jgi:AcrR family transcriptional regulator
MQPKLRKPSTRYHHGSLHDAALEAAGKEIDAHGHVAFTMDRVAKRLGVTPAALYRHYKNRDAILREWLWQTFLRFVEEMDAAAQRPNVDPLLSTGRAYVEFALKNPGWFRLQFSRAGAELSDRQETAQPKYADVLQSELATFFRGDAGAVQRWFLALWACVHGAASMAVEHVLPPLKTDDERLVVAEQQLTTFVAGMHAEARRA